jgi:nucleotide-binding universal stress UspA family protein
MSLKDILAIAIRLEADEPALRAAALLSAQFEAHATALVLGVHASSDYAESIAKLSDVLADLAQGSRGMAAREHARIEEWLSRQHGRFETRKLVIEDALLRREVLAHARHADLAVMTRPAPDAMQEAHEHVLHALLFGSGRPLLVVPPGCTGNNPSDRILIAWDAKREAARAVADALPLLRTARDVVIATIDAIPEDGGHGPTPGKDLAVHLERHGVDVRVNNVDGMGRTAAAALMDEAAALDANLIVMGGYGHARAREWLWGGVTRELTEYARTPLFMSH